MPLSAVPPRTSSLLAPFAAFSLVFPPTRLAGSFTTQPRIVSCPPRTSHLTSPIASFVSTPTALPPSPPPPPASLPGSRSSLGRPPPPIGSCSLKCVSGWLAPLGCTFGGLLRLRGVNLLLTTWQPLATQRAWRPLLVSASAAFAASAAC
ncbi:unnamed protein product [Closterium sp. NIES-53]